MSRNRAPAGGSPVPSRPQSRGLLSFRYKDRGGQPSLKQKEQKCPSVSKSLSPSWTHVSRYLWRVLSSLARVSNRLVSRRQWRIQPFLEPGRSLSPSRHLPWVPRHIRRTAFCACRLNERAVCICPAQRPSGLNHTVRDAVYTSLTQASATCRVHRGRERAACKCRGPCNLESQRQPMRTS
jgi:hypothetical protein